MVFLSTILSTEFDYLSTDLSYLSTDLIRLSTELLTTLAMYGRIRERGGIMNYIKTFLIGILTFITMGLGGMDTILRVLIILMLVDYLLGLICAICGYSKKSKNGGLSSSAGFIGLVKKSGYFLLILIANELDLMMSSTIIRSSVIVFFSVNELISIIEHTGVLGLPIPPIFYQVIDILKEGQNE